MCLLKYENLGGEHVGRQYAAMRSRCQPHSEWWSGPGVIDRIMARQSLPRRPLTSIWGFSAILVRVGNHSIAEKPSSTAERLRLRRSELAGELAALTAPPEAGTNVSFGKRVGDGTAEAVERISTTATARSIARSIADIDRALEKLAEGTYGECDGCGRAIPVERLEAIPATSVCVHCSAGRRP